MIESHIPPNALSALIIDSDALVHNYRYLARRSAPAVCAPVVKSDAYGLGIEHVAPILYQAGAQTFFVACLDEALLLRTLLPEVEIYSLSGLIVSDLAVYARLRIRPVLNSLTEMTMWLDWEQKHESHLPVALHIDTGMNRLGITPEEAFAIVNDPQIASRFAPCLLLSHFVNSRDRKDAGFITQVKSLETMSSLFPQAQVSLDDSAGLFLPYAHHNTVLRPGYALYGGNPTPEDSNPMRPVITFGARILQVRTVQKGETIGYQRAWTAPADRRIAILGAGYGDGYPCTAGWTDRDQEPVGMVVINGVHCPIVGRISMDVMAVDVTALPPAEDMVYPGLMAELVGQNITIDEVAKWGKTTGYEILCRLAQGRGRRYTMILSQTSPCRSAAAILENTESSVSF